MSLILDALKRSRNEAENTAEVPGLATRHYADSTDGRAGWRQALLVAALVVALGVIAWLLWREPAGQAVLVPAQPSHALTMAPARPIEPGSMHDSAAVPVQKVVGVVTPELSGQAAAATEGDADDDIVALYAQAAESSAARSTTAADPQAREDIRREPGLARTDAMPRARPGEAAVFSDKAELAEKAALAEKAEARDKARSAQAREQALDVAELLHRARDGLAAADLAEHSAPMLAELSQQRKDAIPTLLYSAHDYRGSSESSSVLINGRKATVGLEVARGVVVDEILPDSVVLKHATERFRLKALNSWVNL